MKTIAIAFLILCSNPEDSNVFICDSPNSEVYHLDENCDEALVESVEVLK
jgi:hypothetical protein